MTADRPDTIGILPSGALGVALFHHLTSDRPPGDNDVVFLRRSAAADRPGRADLVVETPGGTRVVPASRQCGTLLGADASGELPGVVLVCTNPDQLFDVLRDYVALLEWRHEQDRLLADVTRLPALLLCANGIYFQRVRQTFIELIEESILFGRLPDLWPDVMPAVVGRLLRGITMQTGLRRGHGAAALYRPGPPGRTVVAGGLAAVRRQVVDVLRARGGWYEDAGAHSPTRAEFDKALVNLSSNLLGMLATIDARGGFQPKTVGELMGPAHQPAIHELTAAVLRVGRGLKVYSVQDDVESLHAGMMTLNRGAWNHVPSSLQWLEAQLAAGTPPVDLTPTEEWLLKPLQQYARAMGAPDLIGYFEGLETRLRAALQRVRERAATT